MGNLLAERYSEKIINHEKGRFERKKVKRPNKPPRPSPSLATDTENAKDIVVSFRPLGIPNVDEWSLPMKTEDIPKDVNNVTPALQRYLTGYHKKDFGDQARWTLLVIRARFVNFMGAGVNGGMSLDEVGQELRESAFRTIRKNGGYVVIEYKKA